MTNNTILEIAGLHKRFGDFTALHSIDLKVRDGEFLAIVGPSGSGKTTLIRLFVGMDEPTEGTIWLRGKRIDMVPANKRPTCMVFQSLALFPHMTVGRNIEFPLKIQGVDKDQRHARALELLDLLRLPRAYHSRRVHQCSGGERQRIALARALAFDPEILFFDEPLSALDYRLRKTLEKELKDLHVRTGKTFVYITHSLEEAMAMSDRIAIMRAGRFEQVAPADEIYNRPVSRFVAEFMGEVNLFSLRADEDGRIRAEGMDLTPDVGARLGLAAGETGTLMVRPENAWFVGAGNGRGGDMTARGHLRGELNLGSRFQYEVESETGQRLTVETAREGRHVGPLGEPVTLAWSLDHCHLIRGE